MATSTGGGRREVKNLEKDDDALTVRAEGALILQEHYFGLPETQADCWISASSEYGHVGAN